MNIDISNASTSIVSEMAYEIDVNKDVSSLLHAETLHTAKVIHNKKRMSINFLIFLIASS